MRPAVMRSGSAWSAVAAGILTIALFPHNAEAADEAQPRLGINLNGPADWNTELPFVDVFRLSRPWISQR